MKKRELITQLEHIIETLKRDDSVVEEVEYGYSPSYETLHEAESDSEKIYYYDVLHEEKFNIELVIAHRKPIEKLKHPAVTGRFEKLSYVNYITKQEDYKWKSN